MRSRSKHYFEGSDAFESWGHANVKLMGVLMNILKSINVRDELMISQGLVTGYLGAQQDMMNLILGISERVREMEEKIDLDEKSETRSL